MGKFLISLRRLDRWFQKQKRVLPWRDDPTPYRVWVSEIMLQQTQVITVIPYFERFMERFPSVEVLARASQEEVLLFWAGLGYYSRARNLHRGAQKILKEGRFPQNREEWLDVPGVGQYTAGAILSIAYDQPEAILDGNVERVLSRVRCVSREKGDALFKSRLWKLSRIFVQTGDRKAIQPSILNQALMELGATLCTPKNPRCEVCPLLDLCRAKMKGEINSYPPKKKPKSWIEVEEKMHCLMTDSGQILLRQRQKGEWRAGLWDLLDQSPEEKRFPILGKPRLLGKVDTRHIVTRHKIKRETWVWRVSNQATPREPRLLKACEPPTLVSDRGELRWVSVDQPDVAMGSALKRTLREVMSLSTGKC